MAFNQVDLCNVCSVEKAFWVLTDNLRWETSGISSFLGPGTVLQNSGASDKNSVEML